MYPMAGIMIWLALGAMIGFFAGKATGTSGAFGVGSNTGVSLVAAVLAGFVTTMFWNGDKSMSGLWLSILVAGVAAVVSIVAFRAIYPDRSPRFEDSHNRLR